jgi:hypothetical protein
MTKDDIKFANDYIEKNKTLPRNERPPCLKCTVEKIVICSKIESKPRMGCADFLNYISGTKESNIKLN